MTRSELFRSTLREQVAPFVSLSGSAIDACVAHFDLLSRWNARLNLTSVIDPAQAAVRHYGQSLFLAAHLTPGSVIDVGSGAGFPGVPTGILRSDCAVTLVESDQRKAVFLREASRTLPNVRVASIRAQRMDGRFDWLIARAVSVAELLKLDVADRIALLIADADAGELWTKPLPWGGGVLASRTPLFHFQQQ